MDWLAIGKTALDTGGALFGQEPAPKSTSTGQIARPIVYEGPRGSGSSESGLLGNSTILIIGAVLLGVLFLGS